MKLFNVFNSIQAKLIALFLVSVLFTVTAVVAFNQSLRNLVLASADTSLQTEAEQLANEIDEFNQRNIRSFSIASHLPSLVNFYHTEPDERADSEVRAAVRSTLNSLNIRPYSQFNVSSFALLDLEGNNILDTFMSYEGNFEGDRDYFERPLTSGDAYISTVSFEPARGGAFFYYSVPIRDSIVPNPFIGVLRIQISIVAIQNILLEHGNADDAHVILVDENNIRLLDNRNPELNFRAISTYSALDIEILKQTNQIPQLPASQISIPLPEIEEHILRLDDTRVITAQAGVGDGSPERIALVAMETHAWTLLYGRDAGEFFAPINRQTQETLLLTAVLTISAIGIAFIFSRSLSKPIQQLTGIAQKAATGNLNVHAEISSRDEIGALAHAFNIMIKELKQNKANLEQRVQERTVELQEEINERQRLEEQNIQLALESERTRILADFIQNVSHEFKTPLSIINVQSHMVGRIAGEVVANRVQEITAQSKSIETLVNEMVMMSRLDSENYDVAIQSLFLDEFVQSVCLSEETAFSNKQIKLKTQFTAPDCYIEHNGQMLFTAMKHILDNAIRFTPDGGEVIVKTSISDAVATVKISDNGIGIPAQDLSRVFERFYRVDRARTTRGFGLGLSITKRIIERFNGIIHLDSSSSGGTTVTLTLPVSGQEMVNKGIGLR